MSVEPQVDSAAVTPALRQRLLHESFLAPLLLAVTLFGIHTFDIDLPPMLYFDEERYVPAARQILLHGVNENWVHPNLGKSLMALGIGIFGDHPMAWRLPGAAFGTLAVMGIYWLALALFKNRRDAMIAALLTALNQLIFVQSRVATLDIYALGLMTPALALFASAWCAETPRTFRFSRENGLKLLGSGILFGLGAGAKWISLVPLLTCLALFIFQSRAGLATRLRIGIPALLGVAGLVYLVLLVPMLGMEHPGYAPSVAPSPGTTTSPHGLYGLFQLVELQGRMFANQLNYFNPHPYFSSWYTWPLQLRPIWYHREIASDHLTQSGIILLGNPAILWPGAAAAVLAFWHAIRLRNQAAIFLVATYFPLFTFWALIPRSASLFYYYLPASALLGPLIVHAARELRWPKTVLHAHLALSVALFVYFYPVLANVRLASEAFKSRIWFQSWW